MGHYYPIQWSVAGLCSIQYNSKLFGWIYFYLSIQYRNIWLGIDFQTLHYISRPLSIKFLWWRILKKSTFDVFPAQFSPLNQPEDVPEVGGGGRSWLRFKIRLLPISWLFTVPLSHTLSHFTQQLLRWETREEIGLECPHNNSVKTWCNKTHRTRSLAKVLNFSWDTNFGNPQLPWALTSTIFQLFWAPDPSRKVTE